MLENFLSKLVERRNLSQAEAHQAMSAIMSGSATDAQIAGFLVALRMKGETVDEITGCARAMREAATPINVGDLEVVDTCGTGGDCKGTFNVSTAAAIIAAAAGVPVAKHGNRSVSSGSGSADVLQALGVNIEAPPQVVERCIREANIGFLFAPSLHKAMKYAIGPRRQLAVRTIFNILGPLTNPARAHRQLLGVYSLDLVETIAGVLNNLGARKAMVVHSLDGLDEISICDETVTAEVDGGHITPGRIRPEAFGFKRARPEELTVAGPHESAQAIRAVLANEPGPRRDMALLNAGAAIYVSGKAHSLAAGIQQAAQAVESGRARQTLELLIKLSNEAP